MKQLHPVKLGAILGFLSVFLGAFGTHVLADMITPERLGTFETAVRYQMYHALALLIIGALPFKANRAVLLLFSGTVVFSGSLYLLVATNISILGAVAPIGGLLLLSGWVTLFLSANTNTRLT